MSKLLGLLLCLSCALIFIGCNSKPDMVQVSGVVTLYDKPLPGGRIFFEPIEGSKDKMSAMGDIQDDGTFELFTHEEGDGVILGTYYPVIMDPKEDDEAPQSAAKKRKKIGVVQLTEMPLEVTAEGPHEFTIPITRADMKWAVEDD